MRKNEIGKIIIPGDVNAWPHERQTAKTLAMHGFNVEFIRKSNRYREHSADVFVDGIKWEFKSPTAKHTRTIFKNLNEATEQAERVVLDSRRMKGVPNEAILREVRKQAFEVADLKEVKYISKIGKLLDIKP